ncbi:stress responsive A/B barrel domain-containing protein [Mariannaea sp. PMI_226]|nr:stress responsive A/B barrel domain-containing protein [Mariannaea sp. PMI_226]
MSSSINRITLFKIPDVENQQKLLSIYKEMPHKAVKDGKPYIRAVKAGPTKADQRNQGYTIAVVSVFDSVDDMKYYDDECAAHAELKVFAKSVHQGAMMAFFENELE